MEGPQANEFVHGAMKARVRPQENVVKVVTRRKLTWFGHITCHKSLTKMALHGIGSLQGEAHATGDVLDRQTERVDRTSTNPDEMGREQTCLAFLVTQMCRPCFPYDYAVKGQITDHGSRITDHGSRITVHGSLITDQGAPKIMEKKYFSK